MYKVLPFIRFIYGVVSVMVVVVVGLFTKEILFVVVLSAAAVWLQFYLSGLSIEIRKGRLIKQTGNIFKRKTVYMLKTLCICQTAVFTQWRPGFIRMIYPDRKIYIIGLNGRQVKLLEKIIERN